MNGKPQCEFYDLVDDYFERTLTELEQDVLKRALENDSALRTYFAEHCRDEMLLHRTHADERKKRIDFPLTHTPMRRFRRMAALVTVLFSLAAIYFIQRATLPTHGLMSNPVAEVTELFALENDAVTAVNAGYIRKLDMMSELRTGDVITVPKGGRLSFRYKREDTVIELGPGTSFEIKDAPGAKHFYLHDGILTASVAKQPSGYPMRILTDHAEVEVLGTRFELIARSSTRLSVKSGRVLMKSLDSGEDMIVAGGYAADTDSLQQSEPEPLEFVNLYPVANETLNMDRYMREFIAVDPKRNYRGVLQFDLGDYKGRIVEAELELRVMQHQKDYGGEGMVRAFKVDNVQGFQPGNSIPADAVQVAHYNGTVGAGMALGMTLDPEALDPGLNTLMLTLDKGGNDFWFSSRDGAFAPVLNLKITPEEQGR